MNVSGLAYYFESMNVFNSFRLFALEHELITLALDPYTL